MINNKSKKRGEEMVTGERESTMIELASASTREIQEIRLKPDLNKESLARVKN